MLAPGDADRSSKMILLGVIVGLVIAAVAIVLYACAAVSSMDARSRERDEFFREMHKEMHKDLKEDADQSLHRDAGREKLSD